MSSKLIPEPHRDAIQAVRTKALSAREALAPHDVPLPKIPELLDELGVTFSGQTDYVIWFDPYPDQDGDQGRGQWVYAEFARQTGQIILAHGSNGSATDLVLTDCAIVSESRLSYEVGGEMNDDGSTVTLTRKMDEPEFCQRIAPIVSQVNVLTRYATLLDDLGGGPTAPARTSQAAAADGDMFGEGFDEEEE